jgi:rhodanese-related sulfurtransferase
MGLPIVKKFFEARAAFLIDAREPDEYAAGHIPGAISLPYDQSVTDPAKLESLDTGGKPIIIYCGGGTCEISMNLAFALIEAGHKKVLVYEGGFPEWAEAGLPVEAS